MPELILDLTGLCAFVPMAADVNQPTNRVRVLLVDARTPHGGHNHEPHQPVLVFENRLDATNQRPPDLTFTDNGVAMGLCFLNDLEISIANANSPFLMIVDGPQSGVDCPPQDGSWDAHFAWVVRMGNAHPGAGTVRGELLASTNVDSTVVARVLLTEGELSVRSFAIERTTNPPQILLWRCGPVSGPLSPRQQALAEEARYRFSPGGNFIEILMRPLRPGPSTVPLRLAPDANGRVRAAVQNMPLDDILGRRALPTMPHPRGADLHFEHFYELSTVNPGHGHRPVPHPVGNCPRPFPPDVANPKCPPVQFDPHPNA